MSVAEAPPAVPHSAPELPQLKVVEDATCTFCGCVCDDIDLTVDTDANRITEAKRACVLGKSWFLNHHIEDRPEALVDGKPASYDVAIQRAVDILISANYPVTYGLSDTTSEAQRVAVAISDWIGASVS